MIAPATRRIGIALACLIVLGTGFQFVPRNHSRQVAEGFLQSLQGRSDSAVQGYLAPNAEIFLAGASTALTPQAFESYLKQLQRDHRAFKAGSRMYSTEGGAGWLVDYASAADVDSRNPPAGDVPPGLWMEVRIQGNQIARVWIHFTVEALGRLRVTPADYVRVAAARGTPVPDGWSAGTAAIISAAARNDERLNGSWTNLLDRAVPIVLVVLVASFVCLVTLALWRARRPEPAPARRTELLARLRRARS